MLAKIQYFTGSRRGPGNGVIRFRGCQNIGDVVQFVIGLNRYDAVFRRDRRDVISQAGGDIIGNTRIAGERVVPGAVGEEICLLSAQIDCTLAVECVGDHFRELCAFRIVAILRNGYTG